MGPSPWSEATGRDGNWQWDLLRDRLDGSARFRALLGLRSEGGILSGQAWFDRLHIDDRAIFRALLDPPPVMHDRPGDTRSRREHPFCLEIRARHDDADSWHWLRCFGLARIGPGGMPIRLVGWLCDISDPQQAIETLRRSEQRYALVSETLYDGLFDWDLRTDQIHYSTRWKAMLHLAEATVGNTPEEWLERVHPEDLIWLQATLEAQVGAGGRPFQIEYRVRDAKDSWRWMLCRGTAVLDGAGEPVRLVGSQTDITERKQTEEQLRISEERYALAVRGANDGIWDWNIADRRVYYSPRWKQMLGYQGDDIGTSPEEWLDRVDTVDFPGFRAALELHLSGGSAHLEAEFRMRHADGGLRWMMVRGIAIRDSEGVARRIAGSMSDITTRKRVEQQLIHDAFHDGLTNLPNRALFLDRIGRALERQRRTGARFAVLFLDLDRFKTVNDSLGPMAGDEVLLLIGNRFEQNRDIGDTVARLSADEFAILLEDIADVAEARRKASHFGDIAQWPFRLENRDIVLTASIGITMGEPAMRAQDLLRDASLALYRAKSSGRNRVEVFDPALHLQALRQLRTEADLRTAIDAGQLRLYYQPIVALATGVIAGFEALMRWQHPERGLVAPSDFIPMAEESGLIVPMGRWALNEACHQLASWQRNHERSLFMSINVSGKQFLEDDLVSRVADVLATTRITPQTLKLEITETVLMNDPNRCERVIRALKSQNILLSLDDFGTGYSSLSYLQRFPFDNLKIDQSFVLDLDRHEGSNEIVRIITYLASALNMDVVAEGIETPEAAHCLRKLNCRYGQGWLFGRPVPADQIEKSLGDGAASRVAPAVPSGIAAGT
ncbi:MAG: EAL domain-containing protein [Azospirillaceae bacterium]|nr:EAL domain-containing protein [Azospirillaceae bacterium]